MTTPRANLQSRPKTSAGLIGMTSKSAFAPVRKVNFADVTYISCNQDALPSPSVSRSSFAMRKWMILVLCIISLISQTLILNINSLFLVFIGKFFPVLSVVNLRHSLRILDFLIIFHFFLIIINIFIIITCCCWLQVRWLSSSATSKETSDATKDGRGNRLTPSTATALRGGRRLHNGCSCLLAELDLEDRS